MVKSAQLVPGARGVSRAPDIADTERSAWLTHAERDPLTGLLNRASLEASVRRLWEVDEPNPTTRIAALMIDIDHFTLVNDTLGRPTGDKVLAHVAQVIADSTRAHDLAFRYDGEQFLVLLSQILPVAATAERIRSNLKGTRYEGIDVRVSIGVAVRHPDEAADSLVTRADRALYLAKSYGRDQVVVG